MNIDDLKTSLKEVYIEEINSRNDYYNNISILNEGLLKLFKDKISRKRKVLGTSCYYDYEYDMKIGNSFLYFGEIRKTKSEAVKHFLVSELKYATIENDIIYINKRYQNKLKDKTIYIFKTEITDMDKDGIKTAKVLEKEELTLDQALKYLSKYEFKDVSSEYNKRKQIYTKVMNITKQVLNEIGKEKLNKGFTLTKLDEDEKEYVEEFLNGFNDYFDIIWCDAWEFTNNKARDENEYNKYNDIFMEILSKLDEKFKANNISGKTDYYGDWDDGPIVFVLKKE